jgi:alpha-beta hydrolase superfamily lysophospholipase
LVEDLDEADVHAVLADLRGHSRAKTSRSSWPPAFFASGTADRTDTAVRAEELLADGFGR